MSTQSHPAPESDFNLHVAPGEFVLSRTFDAPRDLVFKAWTEAERLASWWGPAGFKVSVCELNLRPGGVFHYGMQLPDGNQMWGKWVFREIVAPEHLEFIVSFADEEANPIRHPFAPTWPLETLSNITFEEADGRTTVTMRGLPHDATEEERKTFEGGREGMRAGWGGTLDQLAAYLAAAQKPATA